MGNADVVPGVSGGTVALLLGIYDHLIDSIGKFDSQFCRLLVKRNWRQAAEHVHLRFILSLLLGIFGGIICMGTLSHWLLEHQQSRQFTLAAFSGMVLASCFVIGKQIQILNYRDSVRAILLGLIGIAITVLVGAAFKQAPSQVTDPTYLQLFCFAAIAICAMILPGISGALILMILGVYEHLVTLPLKLINGIDLGETAKQLIIFACGAACGLIVFSRVLRFLLTKYRHGTLSLLVGIMLGSLSVLWPFQDINKQPLPIALDVHSALLIITIAFSTSLVLWLVKLSSSAPTQD
jgi:putative membrane protein